MSAIMVTHEWPDGTSIEIAVEVEESFPDALAEAEARCMSIYRGIVLDTEEA